MSQFDPAILQSIDASLCDDSAIVEVEASELRQIVDTDLRRRCAGLKLAARIIGIATSASSELSDEEVLRSVKEVMKRISALRHAALSIVSAEKDSGDFPAVFHIVTSAMVDLITEEWKWRRIDPSSRLLSPDMIASLLEVIVKMQPERFSLAETADVDIITTRRLCVVEAVPKLFSLINLFDYYQSKPDEVVERLLESVVKQAEINTNKFLSVAAPEFSVQSILPRMYGVSVGLMCETYKTCAYRDVSALREMPELDRSILIAQYERMGGMKYDHIIENHQRGMARMVEVTDLILEAQK